MRRLLVGLLILVTWGLTAQPTLAQKGKKFQGGEARYGWLSSLTQGQELARKTGKPLMVVIRCVP